MVQSLIIRSCHHQLHFSDSQVHSTLKSSFYMERLVSTDHPEKCSLELFPTLYSSVGSWTPVILLREGQFLFYRPFLSLIRQRQCLSKKEAFLWPHVPICCSVVKLYPTLCDPMDWQAPLSMGFPRQKYWSGLPFPSPGDILNPGIEPVSPALAGEFFYHWAT